MSQSSFDEETDRLWEEISRNAQMLASLHDSEHSEEAPPPADSGEQASGESGEQASGHGELSSMIDQKPQEPSSIVKPRKRELTPPSLTLRRKSATEVKQIKPPQVKVKRSSSSARDAAAAEVTATGAAVQRRYSDSRLSRPLLRSATAAAAASAKTSDTPVSKSSLAKRYGAIPKTAKTAVKAKSDVHSPTAGYTIDSARLRRGGGGGVRKGGGEF